ncbi:inositol monophosphatase family protein [Halobacterium salinarum]|uniref:inositol monophosphatase family protein n=1 Tax=Halobacterium salinarum TaxID=2242 RepID=UPI0025562738|nr:inositol monophosphatase family protein [Halobacterium salinarum]MDL0131897.1 inositol monophosphatase family protein [Halobacterium salinarum]
MSTSAHPKLWTGVRAARRAGDALRAYDDDSFAYKTNGDVVTDADRLAERTVLDELEREYADHNIVTEESSPNFTPKPRWIIDPIDGTTNFLNGVPHYAVSIAFQGTHAADVGVVYHVPTDTMYTAVEGEGAYADGEPMALSETESLSNALLVTGFDEATMQAQHFEQFRSLLSVAQGVRRLGSAASELAMVASGSADAFFERMLSVWDTAAGVLIVEEAGGEVTRIKMVDGENSEMVLASNGHLHRDLVTLVSTGTVPEKYR